MTKETFILIAQAVGIVAMSMNILSYQGKKQSTIAAFQLFGTCLFSISFFMLEAYTGALLNAIAAVRCVVFLNKKRLHADHPWWLVGFTVACLASYALSFIAFGKEPSAQNLLIELLPVGGMVLTTIGFQKKDAKSVRIYCLINSPLWLTYNIVNFTVGGICAEVIGTTSIIIGYLRLDTKKRRERDEASES